MNYIYLYPTYEQAKQAAQKKAKQLNRDYEFRIPDLEITSGQDRHFFKVVSIDIKLESIMGTIGACDATALFKHLDDIRSRIKFEALIMGKRQNSEKK